MPQRILICTALVSIAVATAMASLPHLANARAAEPPKTLDVSYVPKEAVAAIVLQPRQVFQAPEFEMLPTEVITAQLMEAAGIDAMQVEQVVVLISATTLQAPPSAGAIVRFAL